MLVGRELLKVLAPSTFSDEVISTFGTFKYVAYKILNVFDTPVHVFVSGSSDEPPPDDIMLSTYAFVVS